MAESKSGTTRKRTTSSKPSTLAEALLKAQTSATRVGKDGRNEGQGYDYARAEDVIAEAQRALHEAGLVGYMVPGEVKQTSVESNSGSAGLFVSIHSELVIVHPPDGEELRVPALGTGVDYPGDKAIYKAMTGAAKYGYASVLGIPFGDDPEDAASTSAEARRTTSHESRRSGPQPMTQPQRNAIRRCLSKAGVADDRQAEFVHAIAGDPPTKAGASRLLDELMPLADGDDGELRAAVGALASKHKLSLEDPLPGDDADLDPPPAEADSPSGEEVFDPASGKMEGKGEPAEEPDPAEDAGGEA